MDWKQFIASIIQNVAWPVAVLTVFILIRDRLINLISNIGNLKYKDLEVDFSRIKQVPEPPRSTDRKSEESEAVVIKSRESEQLSDAIEAQIFDAVETSPVAAVLLAWSYVETQLSSATLRAQPHVEIASSSALQNIQILERAGRLSPQQLEVLNEMRSLRNKVAHSNVGERSIHTDQALDYANTAIELARYLDGIDRKRRIFMLPKGAWITLPNGFSEVKDRSASFWRYSRVELPGTGLVAGVGPWESGEALYFGIDIEKERRDGSDTIAELKVGLQYVAADKMNAGAHSIVSFDPTTRVVRFDLGHSVFEYKIQQA